MRCKKQLVMKLKDGTRAYSCGRCPALPTCKKEAAVTARIMREVARDFNRRWGF